MFSWQIVISLSLKKEYPLESDMSTIPCHRRAKKSVIKSIDSKAVSLA